MKQGEEKEKKKKEATLNRASVICETIWHSLQHLHLGIQKGQRQRGGKIQGPIFNFSTFDESYTSTNANSSRQKQRTPRKDKLNQNCWKPVTKKKKSWKQPEVEKRPFCKGHNTADTASEITKLADTKRPSLKPCKKNKQKNPRQPEILYPAGKSYTNEGQMKTSSDNQKLTCS